MPGVMPFPRRMQRFLDNVTAEENRLAPHHSRYQLAYGVEELTLAAAIVPVQDGFGTKLRKSIRQQNLLRCVNQRSACPRPFLPGFGVEQAQSILGLGVVDIDLQNLLVMRA